HLTPRTPSPTLSPYTTLFRSLPPPAAPAPASPRRTPARGTKPLPAPGAAREYSAGTLAPTDRCEREVAPSPSVGPPWSGASHPRSEEHTSELQSRVDLVCRLL